MDNNLNSQRFMNWGMDKVTDRSRNMRRNVMTAENALIESINWENRTGFVTISYGVMGDFCMVHMQVVTLVVGSDTVIRDQFGQHLSFRDLKEGMTVDAVFSSAMTRSIPPQSRAYSITVIENIDSNTTEGNVAFVDMANNFLYTGNPNDINTQMRFVVTDSTIIRDRRGRRIRLRDVRPGDFVMVEHASFQTASIPPQTTAFEIQIL